MGALIRLPRSRPGLCRRPRSSRLRLMRVVYVDGEEVEKQVIAEVGGLRERP
ncbi:MAG: hypothetical protein LAN37_11410 [Acidobacteriia bacterium]|nr:hypothetical protein [Terriglobia bacterium]